jgi:hypothetical protein
MVNQELKDRVQDPTLSVRKQALANITALLLAQPNSAMIQVYVEWRLRCLSSRFELAHIEPGWMLLSRS